MSRLDIYMYMYVTDRNPQVHVLWGKHERFLIRNYDKMPLASARTFPRMDGRDRYTQAAGKQAPRLAAAKTPASVCSQPTSPPFHPLLFTSSPPRPTPLPTTVFPSHQLLFALFSLFILSLFSPPHTLCILHRCLSHYLSL